MKTTHLALAAALATLAACAATDRTESHGTPRAAGSDVDAAALGVKNGRNPAPGLITGGQLTEEQFRCLAAQGYTTMVSLRPASEEGAGFEEGIAASAGATFHRIAVAGKDGLTRENAVRLHEILDGAGESGAVVYCASGNRVGALFALKAAWVEGKSVEEALGVGRERGMVALEEVVKEMLEDGER